MITVAVCYRHATPHNSENPRKHGRQRLNRELEQS
jgi:hypothetical protein